MEGLLPPNVSLHQTEPLRGGSDKKVELHIGASSEGDEIVVWRRSENGEGLTQEHILSTDSSSEAADRFNYELGQLGAAGYDISAEEEVDPQFIEKLLPKPAPERRDGRAEDDQGQGPEQSGPSSILY